MRKRIKFGREWVEDEVENEKRIRTGMKMRVGCGQIRRWEPAEDEEEIEDTDEKQIYLMLWQLDNQCFRISAYCVGGVDVIFGTIKIFQQIIDFIQSLPSAHILHIHIRMTWYGHAQNAHVGMTRVLGVKSAKVYTKNANAQFSNCSI